MNPTLSRRCCLGLLLATPLLAACKQSTVPTVHPLPIDKNTSCSLDGMNLMDYPGPKGQIQYEQGAPDFFCDTIELFAVYLRPEQRRKMVGVYVQDMAVADWDHPVGNWIDAKQAFYVIGSRRTGSMGPSFASFATETAAKAFAAKEGGKVYPFAQIRPDMVELDGGVVKDKMM